MATTSLNDGRTARAARTRDAVVEALLALLDDGQLRPTARAIADRAGVSLRSVYVHFDDLEDLFTAAAAKQFERMAALYEPLPADGPLEARIAALVTQRSRMMEAGAPVARATRLQEPFSPTLAKVMHLVRKGMREGVARVFATELDRVKGAERERLLAAVDVAAGSATWETLRVHDGLGVDASRAVVVEMLTRLLAR
jgi:AcrR family transcriptional regulator